MSGASDAIIAQLRANGGPITRDRYISYIYFGTPPDELNAEEEAEIPDYPWDNDDGAPDHPVSHEDPRTDGGDG
jgi:hypothetical protein